MKLLFKLYHKIFSPLFHALSVALSGNPYTGCRFEPTCSCYLEQAVQKYGYLKGMILGIKRILRCHPFSRSGGYDPV